jgi:3-methyladenine DNA glycosylase AlkC
VEQPIPLAVTAARRGARRPTDVPPEVLAGLVAGRPSVNHMEQIAMDAGALLARVIPEAAARADELRVPRFLDRMRAGARIAWDAYGENLFEVAAGWESDTARGWAAFAVPYVDGGVRQQLPLALRFADDSHFAVREWAWLGVRPSVAGDAATSVGLLAAHVGDASPRIRRFCSEVTRPRGVWSTHIVLFKKDPDACLPVLDPLAAAPERYVQNSVGNWLNDASRTAPAWVEGVCARWVAEHGSTVSYVCRRALRGLTRGAADSAAPRPRPATSK